MEITRRNLVKGAAWSVPVIAVASAVPLASASTTPPEKIPVSCVLLNDTGSPYYRVEYSTGPGATLHRSEVVKDKVLKEMCPVPAKGNEG